MRSAIEWVRRHQIISFFALVYVISFGVGIPLVYLFRGDHTVQRTLQFFVVRLLLYGPALAGMIVARAADRGERTGGKNRRWLAFVISWALAASVSVLYLMRTSGGGADPSSFIVISRLAALFPAFVISGAFSRITSIRRYISTLVRPRGGVVWYLVALLLFDHPPAGEFPDARHGRRQPHAGRGNGFGLFTWSCITFVHASFTPGRQ